MAEAVAKIGQCLQYGNLIAGYLKPSNSALAEAQYHTRRHQAILVDPHFSLSLSSSPHRSSGEGRSTNFPVQQHSIMSFGWSVGDILAAVGLLNKIRVALKDAGGASSGYQDEIAFLQSLVVTLRHLDSLHLAPIDPEIAATLQKHCLQVRKPLDAFLQNAQRRFAVLGNTTPWADVSSVHYKIRWELSTSKQVKGLREKISGNLDAIQIALSQQTL